MGTGPFAVPTFVSLIESGHTVCALFTRPVPPAKGRKRKPTHPMRDAAVARDISVFDPADINNEAAREQVVSLEPDLLVVCDYGQILSRSSLTAAPLGGINLHGSLLPKYRGAAPVNWAVYHGEKETGVTVIHMTPKLDGGPCLVKSETPIGPDETAAELEPRLARLGVAAVHQAIEMLANWDRKSGVGEMQDSRQATRAPRLTKSDGRIDWSHSAEQIRNQVRAFQPWPGSFFDWDRGQGQPLRMILESVSIVDQPSGTAKPGSVVSVDREHLWVATSDQLLSLDRIQPAGKKPMGIDAFLRGYPIPVGSTFNPPHPGDPSH